MTTNENPAAVRVCAIADIECSRNCGTGACKREMTTENSRADALTDEQIVCLTKQVTGWQTHGWIPSEPLGHFYAGPHHQASVDSVIRIVRACLLAASPVEQPAAAPFSLTEDDGQEGLAFQYAHELIAKRLGAKPTPAPADERAVEESSAPTGIYDGDTPESRAAFRDYDRRELVRTRSTWQIWRDACAWQARAASANETGAEGTQAARIKALRDAVEGECDGLAIDEKQAASILSWLDSTSPNGIVSSPAMAADAAESPAAANLLAEPHTGMRVDYSGLLKQARHALKHGMRDMGSAEMLHQLQNHLTELGQRWYAGDTAVVDELLQLYCVEKDARDALAAARTGASS